MKIKTLKKQLNKIPDNYDLAIYQQCAGFEIIGANIAKFGKEFSIHIADFKDEEKTYLRQCEEALRQICLLADFDPSDTEGTSPHEVVMAIKSLIRHLKIKAK